MKPLLIIAWLFYGIASLAQIQEIPSDTIFNDTVKTNFYFAITLTPTINGQQMYNTAIVLKTKSGKLIPTYITKTNFLLQITGQQESKANPNNVNYMKEYQIFWQTFDQLWKLQYSEYPFDRKQNPDTKGWAKMKYSPSKGQLQFLRQYGIKNITDFFYGKNLFRILKDIQDTNWVGNYKNL